MSRINTGAELTTFITGLNGDATIDADLIGVLAETAKAIIEEEREWAALRKTNSSLSAAPTGTWQTQKSLAGITDFSRFYGEYPVRLFDSTSNRIERYRQVPFDRRLEYKDVGNTFVHDVNAGIIYLNGLVPFSGTLYINYIAATEELDLTIETAIWTTFPARFLPLIGFYAVGIYKGAVDYDSINKLMMPENRATLQALKNAMEKWDDKLQLAEIEHNDPTEAYGEYPRDRAINRYDD